MRRGSILVLVLIFPLASGLITNVEMPEIKQNLGYEIIIDSKENQWTQSMWDDLEQYGITPLRLLSDTELLVWKTDLSVEKLDGFDFYNGHNTEWRSPGIGLDGFRGEIRVVFEPNLPAYASEYVINSFSSLGFGISNYLEDYNSIIPHRKL